ncbi:MAG: hypothetical protein HYV76_01150 [Candidatus Vogelbacteria bacterium]|nr:hypothetical protein [Candidatus Vogelbacteria bacterium]
MLAKSANFTLTNKTLTLGLIVVLAGVLTWSLVWPVVVQAAELTAEENTFTTTALPPVDDPDDSPDSVELVDTENTFSTQAEGGEPAESTVGGENSFTTAQVLIVLPAVGIERSFTTTNANAPSAFVISAESSFTTTSTTSGNGTKEIISAEQSFTTSVDGGGGGETEEVVSGESSFTTTNNGGTATNRVISTEQNFTTSSGDNDDDTDDDTDNGGGGGGHRRRPPVELPAQCSPYLLKFIKWGANNDPLEVRKLQYFLRDFEGFTDIQVTGIYDRATYEAVTIFQKRYINDVLSPWGIIDSTGYVYITTTLKINYIVCGIERPIALDLRERYRVALERGGEFNLDELVATTTTSTTTAPVKAGFLQAAAVALLDFAKWLNWCYLLSLLLLIVSVILMLLWRETRRERDKARREKELAQALLTAVTRDHTDTANDAMPMSEALLSSSLFHPAPLDEEEPELPLESSIEAEPVLDENLDEAVAEWQEIPESEAVDDKLTSN